MNLKRTMDLTVAERASVWPFPRMNLKGTMDLTGGNKGNGEAMKWRG
jgi:hypothetical protein